LEGAGQLQARTDRDDRVEQSLQPIPGLADLGEAVLQLGQQLIETQPREGHADR
jgi:hypothetical protein